jgi:chromate transporter
MSLTLTATDWLALLTHFLSLSLLAIGGAIATAPDMQRYLVDQQHWLSDSQFNSSIALAQAAPGPNVLFIALLGWNVGVNAAGGMSTGWAAWGYGLLGVSMAMTGILLPSTTLTFAATRWAHQNRELRAVRAFKQGLAPIVVALLIATGWVLTSSHGRSIDNWPLWLLTAVSALIVWRTRLHLLWLLGAGALVGWLGWV